MNTMGPEAHMLHFAKEDVNLKKIGSAIRKI